jgi:chromosome segregation ATPase
MTVISDDQNRRRLADEAKKDKEAFAAKQRAQDRSRLQLRLNNLKVDLEKLQRELTTKETKLQGEKRYEADTKRKIVSEKNIGRQNETRIAQLKIELAQLTRGGGGTQSGLLLEVQREEAKEREIEREESELKNKIEKDNGIISSLKAKLDRLVHGVTSFRSHLSLEAKKEEEKERALDREVTDLKFKIENQNREISKLQAELDRLKKDVLKEQSELSDKEAKLRSEKREEVDIKNKIVDEHASEERRNTEINNLQSEIYRLNEEALRFKSALDAKEAKLRSEKREEVDIKKKIADEHVNKGHRQLEINKIKSEIDRLTNGGAEAQSILGVKERQVEMEEKELEKEASELKTKIEDIKRSMDDIVRQINSIR